MTGTSPTCLARAAEAIGGARPGGAEAVPSTTGRGTARDVRAAARTRLEHHAAIWNERPLVQQIYRGYHERIRRAMSRVGGAHLEVGAGHGSFAESFDGVVSCDVVPCPWLSCAADASCLPFCDESLANIVMIDVLHHLPGPARFFEEAVRTLAPGGRIVLLEPYVSPVSFLAWRFVHDEDICLRADPLASPKAVPRGERLPEDPWHANTAIPTLLFWRELPRFSRCFPDLRVLTRERFDTLVYPLSGGFEQRRLLPTWAVPLARRVEMGLNLFAGLLAFRCFIVLEKPARAA